MVVVSCFVARPMWYRVNFSSSPSVVLRLWTLQLRFLVAMLPWKCRFGKQRGVRFTCFMLHVASAVPLVGIMCGGFELAIREEYVLFFFRWTEQVHG